MAGNLIFLNNEHWALHKLTTIKILQCNLTKADPSPGLAKCCCTFLHNNLMRPFTILIILAPSNFACGNPRSAFGFGLGWGQIRIITGSQIMKQTYKIVRPGRTLRPKNCGKTLISDHSEIYCVFLSKSSQVKNNDFVHSM